MTPLSLILSSSGDFLFLDFSPVSLTALNPFLSNSLSSFLILLLSFPVRGLTLAATDPVRSFFKILLFPLFYSVSVFLMAFGGSFFFKFPRKQFF